MALKDLIIQPIRKDDLPILHEIINTPEVAELLGPIPPLTYERFEEWHKQYIEDPKNIALVAQVNKKVIGLVFINIGEDLHRYDAWLGLYVHKKFWRKGVGTRLMKAIIDAARDVGLKRISLGVFGENRRAMRLYEKLGFKKEGYSKYNVYTMGKYMDVALMGLLLDEDLPEEE